MVQSIQQLRASSNESLRRNVASICCCLGRSNAAITIALPIKALALSHKQLLQTARLLVISIVATRPRWRVCSLTFEFKQNDVACCNPWYLWQCGLLVMQTGHSRVYSYRMCSLHTPVYCVKHREEQLFILQCELIPAKRTSMSIFPSMPNC